MRVLVTGHRGYVGAVMVPMLLRAGHEVVGFDTGYYSGCDFGPFAEAVPAIDRDLRDARAADLESFDAVIFLAALSNDALGNLDPTLTYDINLAATVAFAARAKEAGVSRFLFSSSCSLYGAAGDEFLTETAAFHPVTPYGEAKIRVEQALAGLASARFSPTYLRNATAYGVSPSLRGDLVVNNLTGYAYTTGEVLIKSDGTPWRPLVHVEDIGRAFLAVLEARQVVVHDQAFNVGVTSENYRIKDVAEIVRAVVPGSRVIYAPGASPDLRNYRVDFSKIERALPAFRPAWIVRKGVEELHAAYRAHGLTKEEFLSSRYLRIGTILDRRSRGELDESLRWTRERGRRERSG